MSFAGPLLLIELRVDGETSVPIFKRGSVCVCETLGVTGIPSNLYSCETRCTLEQGGNPTLQLIG